MRDINKLPKWAQEIIAIKDGHIAMLERDNQFLKDERASVEHGTSPISYFVSPDFDKVYYLPRHTKLTFKFGKRDFIDVSLGDGIVHISTSGRMRINPRASNSVWVSNE